MNHHEHAEHENMKDAGECCGAGCCNDESCCENETSLKVGYILQWIFLGGAFVCSLLTLLLLPKVVKKAIVHDQALKAGGVENYEKLSKEIYETKDYKDMMKSQVDLFIEQNKATIQMYKNQANKPAQPEIQMEEGTGNAVATGAKN